jgi:hypothetical protein
MLLLAISLQDVDNKILYTCILMLRAGFARYGLSL